MSTSPHDPWDTLRPGSPEWRETLDHLTAATLCAVLDHDLPTYGALLAEASRLRGPWAQTLMLGWVDALIAHAQPDDPQSTEPARVRLAFADPSGARVDVDDVPPPVRWASRLVAARLARDTDTTRALLRDPADVHTTADRAVAVLDLTTAALRGPGRLSVIPTGSTG